MASKQYMVHSINKNTFAIEEKTRMNQGICYLVCGEEKALLIDTCFGYEGFKEVIEGITDLPVVVANTHAHLDHIGGNHYFDELWYHEADRKIFELHVNPEYTLGLLTEGMPRPIKALMGKMSKKMLHIDAKGNYHYFNDTHIFKLGGRDVEVIPTPGHTPGCVCFLDRQNRLLFSGDSVCEWGILLHFSGEGCPPAVFLDSMQRLKELEAEFDTIWPGHHKFPVEKNYIDDYLACAQQITAGQAEYGTTKGRACAKYGRILITVPQALVTSKN